MQKFQSVCPFCGTGCSLTLYVENNDIVKVEPNKNAPSNKGMACVKGLSSHEFVKNKERLKKPLIKKNNKFVEFSWDEAIRYVAKNLKQIIKKHGGNSIGILNSSKCTNEENFLMYELASKVLKSPNVDQCARLCHMPSGIAYSKMFGISAMSCSYSDFEKAKAIMICGANPAVQHPIIFNHILNAKRKGVKLIVVDPRKSKTAKSADIHVEIEEGKDDAFYIAICKYLIKNNLIDKEMLRRTKDYDFFIEELKPFGDINELCEYAGVNPNLVEEIGQLIGNNKTIFINGLGLTESAGCVTNVELVGCMALLTGNIGKEGTGVAPLRGQCNVQGASDIQAYYNKKLKYDKNGFPYFEKKFNTALSSTEMVEGILTGQIKALYIMGENPAMSHPNLKLNYKAFKKAEFIVVQDIFMTETAKFADVVLPAASFAEKDGTFTNSERRVQLLEKAVSYNGIEDWKIICMIAKAMGNKKDFNYKNTKQIWDKLRKKIDIYSEITYKKIKQNYGVQFPATKKSEKVLYKSYFYHKEGKAIFPSIRIYPPSMIRNKNFPFRLITAGTLEHFQTGTMSRHCQTLTKINNEPFVNINPKDAKRLKIKDNTMVEITAPNKQKIKAKAKITNDVKENYLFMPVHFNEAKVNLLTSEKLIDISKTPEYKGIIVKIKKI
ncbi:formate dehydrogenase subunit alpha [Candidatus Woesearchaeota archaeon]|nr:MAG: formate dehydrogenase subunit alpha [Candidatus Woesearchaeota archaeon]